MTLVGGCRGGVVGALLIASGPAWGGMTQVLLESGPYQVSVDGAGSYSSSSMTYAVTRPTATSTVHAAWATVTSVWGQADPGSGCLTVGGVGLTLNQVDSDSASGGTVTTRFDDVTTQLAAYLDALPAGVNSVPVTECGRTPASNDGNGLFVVWEDPAFPEAVVSLSMGTVLTGSNPSLVLATEPIDATSPGFSLDLGLGISFSAGSAFGQTSEVDVNGVVVATDAGGYDDGGSTNGGLYTLGGDGDSASAERYDATALVADGDTAITVDLLGNTIDDYVTVMWVFAPGAQLDCGQGPDADADGVADRCDRCPGVDDALDDDGDGAPDGCDLCPGADDEDDDDGDAVPDGCDACPNGSDVLDTDGDGLADGCDACAAGDDALDADGDAIPDACDACAGADDGVDLDQDGFADGCDATVSFLSPKRGPTGGGALTRVLGAGFDDTCVAAFDGLAAPTERVDASTLSAEPPPHAEGLVDVTVSCAHGSALLVGGYTYYDDQVDTASSPVLQLVLPNVVLPSGGATVTAEGTGFAFGVRVRVDRVVVPATQLDDGHLTFLAPPHREGLASVEVVNPDGLSDTLDGALLYVAAPPEPAPVDSGEAAPDHGGDVGGCSVGPAGGPGAVIALLALLRRDRRR